MYGKQKVAAIHDVCSLLIHKNRKLVTEREREREKEKENISAFNKKKKCVNIEQSIGALQ